MDPTDDISGEVGRSAGADAAVLDAVAVRTRDRLAPAQHWPGFVTGRGQGCARVRVSPPLLEQAIAVVDELFQPDLAHEWILTLVVAC
jgi:hypothetical protein